MAKPEQNHDDILQGRLIKRVLVTEVKEIDQAQVKYIAGKGFKNPDWLSARVFNVENNQLEYKQRLKHRFVDMKRIMKGKGKAKTKKPKKNHPIYNRIIWGHYNNVVRELKYGYTDAVKEEMKKLEE
ncbi:hypothetical protein ACLI1A_10090 [Flavobacterium sp. RHBU_3]|uniref:hypothetical protein n=1 Tax=Flavobacterium sp. RHBU_3 TaxID=3391184 RepID=UPI003984EC0F